MVARAGASSNTTMATARAGGITRLISITPRRLEVGCRETAARLSSNICGTGSRILASSAVQVSTRRVASSKRTTNPVLGPKIGIGKRRRRTTGSLATSIPFALATCRARRTAALRDESRSPTHLNSKLSIGPNTIASGARWLTASSVG